MNDRLAFEVELFADLMVQIDDPFGEREAAFLAAGLDEDTYRNLVQSWRDRFDRGGSELALRFADRYEAKRGEVLEARRRRAGGELDAADARFLNTDAQSFREEAAQVAREPVAADAAPPVRPQAEIAAPAAPPREVPSFVMAAAQLAALPPPSARPPASFAGTMDISHAVPKASLPFAPASEARAVEPAPVSKPRPNVPTGTADISAAVPRELLPFADSGAPRSVARPPQRLAGTADISEFVPRAATPFAAPSAPPPPVAQTAPRKRLIRFDPQTGQPLPAPIWVDLPPEPEGQKK